MKTQLMGILNVTSDSYYAQSRYVSVADAINQAMTFQAEGADILDIGAESTRPGANSISAEEELDRLLPVLEGLQGKVALPLSVDTMKAKVAEKAIPYGVTLLNDISGFRDPLMIEIAATHPVDICVMHMQGEPKTMQNNPYYEEGVISYLIRWFEAKIEHLLSYGIKKEQIILDPGIGFGKTVADNLEIIHNLPKIRSLGFRVLLGLSRKTFIQKLVCKPVEEVLSATLAMNVIAIMNGADIIRVHDVREHRDVINILDNYRHKNRLF